MQQRNLTTKPIAFFGDIHGHWDFLKQIPEVLDDHFWIFVGDIMDSFTQPLKYQVACLTQIRDWIDEGKAKMVAGNHDLQYVNKFHTCSGYKADTFTRMMVYRDFILGLPPCILIDNVLVTHAGLHRTIHDTLIQENPGCGIEELLIESAKTVSGAAHQIGIARGGGAPQGGIWWCDWSLEFEPVPGLNQVFGHSNSIRMPRHFDEELDGNLRFVRFCDSRSYNIDCLGRNGVFDILTYDNYKFGRIRLKFDEHDKLVRVA